MRIVKRNDFFDLDELFDFPVARTTSLLRTDVLEEDDKYVLDIEVPGFNKENIAISFEEGYLNIEAKQETTEESNDKYLRRERTTENANRKYYFGEVDYDAIKASFKDGLLNVEVPKKKPLVKTISIE
jgi:HSP20 family molecular chaperone IbpA